MLLLSIVLQWRVTELHWRVTELQRRVTELQWRVTVGIVCAIAVCLWNESYSIYPELSVFEK